MCWNSSTIHKKDNFFIHTEIGFQKLVKRADGEWRAFFDIASWIEAVSIAYYDLEVEAADSQFDESVNNWYNLNNVSLF